MESTPLYRQRCSAPGGGCSGPCRRCCEGVTLRHALEVRHPSFADPKFVELARRNGAAIVYADHETFPKIDEATAEFTYARLMQTKEKPKTGFTGKELDHWAAQAKDWARRGDVFLYVISGAKVNNPAAAMALINKVQG